MRQSEARLCKEHNRVYGENKPLNSLDYNDFRTETAEGESDAERKGCGAFRARRHARQDICRALGRDRQNVPAQRGRPRHDARQARRLARRPGPHLHQARPDPLCAVGHASPGILHGAPIASILHHARAFRGHRRPSERRLRRRLPRGVRIHRRRTARVGFHRPGPSRRSAQERPRGGRQGAPSSRARGHAARHPAHAPRRRPAQPDRRAYDGLGHGRHGHGRGHR